MTIQPLTRAALAATLIASFSHVALADMAPADVQVPDGNTVALETVGVGAITYMCEAKGDGTMGWVFKGPHAALNDSDGAQVGRLLWTACYLGSVGWLQSDRHSVGNCREW